MGESPGEWEMTLATDLSMAARAFGAAKSIRRRRHRSLAVTLAAGAVLLAGCQTVPFDPLINTEFSQDHYCFPTECLSGASSLYDTDSKVIYPEWSPDWDIGLGTQSNGWMLDGAISLPNPTGVDDYGWFDVPWPVTGTVEMTLTEIGAPPACRIGSTALAGAVISADLTELTFTDTFTSEADVFGRDYTVNLLCADH